ncbi:hypothetical protein UY3_16324 [Chelonia mydas]|uniref:Uncharacterized protein n=1 Tax=Chelonia mydas TaxID=8469 RepID=M7AMZ4_CHEMY|nr:hypothetical protein UY3_16324 [Chelonia mydas]
MAAPPPPSPGPASAQSPRQPPGGVGRQRDVVTTHRGCEERERASQHRGVTLKRLANGLRDRTGAGLDELRDVSASRTPGRKGAKSGVSFLEKTSPTEQGNQETATLSIILKLPQQQLPEILENNPTEQMQRVEAGSVHGNQEIHSLLPGRVLEKQNPVDKA